ncbi:hypothetical protein ACFQ5N_04240 [Lutibacter holmesii]|uniref:DUF4377 domain-containing protein n=1 Tax=Lutibacter holmesii TaxID=1137985 RepID=A0ABW3WLV1_9FLAO
MRQLTLLFIFFTVLGCKNNECEGIACFSPPPNFSFELVDKATGENLFTNETLNSNDIKVVDEENNAVSYSFISENNYNILSLNEIGWNLDPHTYTITVGDLVEFTLELDMEEKYENCCTFFKTETFQLSGYEYEQSNTTDIYTIQID